MLLYSVQQDASFQLSNVPSQYITFWGEIWNNFPKRYFFPHLFGPSKRARIVCIVISAPRHFINTIKHYSIMIFPFYFLKVRSFSNDNILVKIIFLKYRFQLLFVHIKRHQQKIMLIDNWFLAKDKTAQDKTVQDTRIVNRPGVAGAVLQSPL